MSNLKRNDTQNETYARILGKIVTVLIKQYFPLYLLFYL